MNENTVLIIGAGPMAEAYFAALHARGDNVIVFGRGQQSAAEFEKQTGFRPGTGDLAEQFAALPTAPKTAVVATGIMELSAATQTALRCGVAKILIEKPGAPTISKMAELAHEDPDGRVLVAYNRRFLPSVARAREIIAEDGGVQSFHFEFTELSDRVVATPRPEAVKTNWELANSSHVIDLAFDLAGAEKSLGDVQLDGIAAQGELAWHPNGSRFVGCGRVRNDAVFSYFADWTSGGGWNVELCTPKRRLILKPLESLRMQMRESFKIENVTLEPTSAGLKPGLPPMLDAFLGGNHGSATLPTAAEQVSRMKLFARLTGLPHPATTT